MGITSDEDRLDPVVEVLEADDGRDGPLLDADVTTLIVYQTRGQLLVKTKQ